MDDFTEQGGIVLANTQYLRTQTLKDGITVKENTCLTILHKRQFGPASRVCADRWRIHSETSRRKG